MLLRCFENGKKLCDNLICTKCDVKVSIFKNKNNENVFLKLKPKQNIKPQKMNVIYLPDDATLLQALKFMSPKYVTIFYIDSRLVAEDRIVRLLAQGKSPSTPIVECAV